MGMQVNTQNFDKIFKLCEISIRANLLCVEIYASLDKRMWRLGWLEQLHAALMVMRSNATWPLFCSTFSFIFEYPLLKVCARP
jgi:hypothetical protein